MAEKVRVRLQNGSHKTITKARADQLGLTPLKQDAVGRDGRDLPVKHRVELGTASAAKKSTSEAKSSADASKE